ncbi:hypothetical protein PPBDW_II1332 [Photobacterium kishitanii]|nr:hypothetical protein PPBDW_II1332 [Photobacterium kishitanii]
MAFFIPLTNEPPKKNFYWSSLIFFVLNMEDIAIKLNYNTNDFMITN